jgi:hypothetical protein
MSKIVLFFIHGMGDQAEGWEVEAKSALEKSHKAMLGLDNFNSVYEVIPIQYQQFFTAYWNEFNTRAEALKKIPIGSAVPEILSKVVGFAQQGVNDKNPWISHWGDVALYLGTHLGDQVRANVWHQIISALAERGTPRFGIIAHSLGTRVIYDVLQRAYSDDTGTTVRLYGKARLLALISNIIRLSSFSEDHLKNNMVVFPSRERDDGACWRYANIWHPLDPIARIRQFNVERYPILAQALGVHEAEAKPTDVVGSIKEVHNLAHYLAVPEVAACIINNLEWITTSDSGPVTQSQIDAYRVSYEQTTVSGNWLEKARQIELLDLLKIENWSEIVDLLEDHQ